MQTLLRAGAVASIKLEVFDILLRLQGCSALQLQRLVSDAGFLLYRSGDESTGVPTEASRISPDSVPSLAQGVPYNLWCIHRAPSPPSLTPPPSPASSDSGPGPDAAGSEAIAAAAASAVPVVPSVVGASAPMGEWRRRRQFLRKQRTLRRLAEGEMRRRDS